MKAGDFNKNRKQKENQISKKQKKNRNVSGKRKQNDVRVQNNVLSQP